MISSNPNLIVEYSKHCSAESMSRLTMDCQVTPEVITAASMITPLRLNSPSTDDVDLKYACFKRSLRESIERLEKSVELEITRYM